MKKEIKNFIEIRGVSMIGYLPVKLNIINIDEFIEDVLYREEDHRIDGINKLFELIDTIEKIGCVYFDQSYKVKLIQYGIGLDKFINPVKEAYKTYPFLPFYKFKEIRLALAHEGAFLDVLKNDPSARIRRIVASKGYALEKLKNDGSSLVRKSAVYGAVYYGKIKILEELSYDSDREVRLLAMKWLTVLKNPNCYYYPEFVNSNIKEIVLNPTEEEKQELERISKNYKETEIKALDKQEKLFLAELGLFSNILKDEDDEEIQQLLINRGAEQDTLVSSPYAEIRKSVARCAYTYNRKDILNKLKDDSCPEVRWSAIKYLRYLDDPNIYKPFKEADNEETI